jgi:3'-phosphoadenosine 5'-phosphosulfate sulfotransferase (PAPS reductase)/FAD synthetase
MGEGTTVKHIVFFSSGIGSWACAKVVAQQHGTRDLILLFMDTNIEDEDNYRFLREAAANVGGQLIHLRNEEDPFDVFKRKRFMGNSRVDPCSRILKRERADDWIASHFTPDECRCYVGIDWTEQHRFHRLAERKLPYVYEAPLIDTAWTKPHMLKWAEREGLSPPRMYAMGFQHANCGGFCIKSGQAQFKKLWENFPERYLEMERKEQEV